MIDLQKATDMYVCNVMGQPLYMVDGLDESSVSLVPRLNGQYDLEFSVEHAADEISVSYESLQEGMYVYMDSVGYFKLRNPRETITPDRFLKTITAYSCDAELDDKNLNIEINMGTETSQEYLVTRQSDETEVLVDPRTGIPYDWIVLHNTFPAQLDEFNTFITALLGGDDSIEVGVIDAEYETIKSMLDLIPRLKSKLMSVGENDDISGLTDIVTYEEIVDGETQTVKFLMQSYASYNVDENGETTSVTINRSIIDRITELIDYYTAYGAQLSLLDIVCAKTGDNWSVGTVYGESDGDYTLSNTHYQFEINETIYSFLTSTLAEKLKSVVNFDIQNKKINVTPIEHLGSDTGITLSYNKLLNQLNLETDEDSLCTRLDVRGGNDITLEQVNFGEPYVVDIDYKLGVRNSAGERIYVPDLLAEKYARYHTYREDYLRPAYVELTRLYNRINDERTELIDRVPRYYMNNDWGTYSDNDLADQLNAYEQLLRALLQCYADDYGMPSTDNTYWTRQSNSVELPVWMSEIYLGIDSYQYYPTVSKIQQTMYWWDYYAYHQTITQIHIAQAARLATNEQTGFSYGTLKNEELLACIHAWETEWSLYGTSELGVKISSYEMSMQTMVDASSVIRKHLTYTEAAALTDSESNEHYFTTSDPSADDYLSASDYYKICRILASGKIWESLEDSEKELFVDDLWFNALKTAGISPNIPANATIDIYQFDELSDEERAWFGNIEANYFFDKYKELYDYRVAAQAKLDELNEQVNMLQHAMDAIQLKRDDLTQHAQLSTYVCEQPDDIDIPEDLDASYSAVFEDFNDDYLDAFDAINGLEEEESFGENEVKIINLLYRDAEYTNENILTTSLNNTVDTVDILNELYEDALEQVSIVSRPQIHFTVDADNLFAIDEFAPFLSQFELGNYFYVEYKDGTLVRVRFVEYGFNPYIPSGGITMQFSTMVRSKTRVTDIESILGLATGGGISSFGSGGSSSSQGGAYGTNLSVAISDTMLGKLLGMSSGTTLGNALTSFMVSPTASSVRRISEALRSDVNRIVNAAVGAGFTILSQQTAKKPVYQGLRDGDTIVSADCLEGGLIRSKQRYSKRTAYADAASRTGLFSTDSNDTDYLSESTYGDICTVLEINNVAWSSLNATQKALFSNDAARFEQFLNAELVTEPVSWFDMDRGTFSYAEGGLTFTPSSNTSVGVLSLNGLVHATGGDLGGVYIGSASADNMSEGHMYIGAHGMYRIKRDNSNRLLSQFDLRPVTASELNAADSIFDRDSFVLPSFGQDDTYLGFQRLVYTNTQTAPRYTYTSFLTHSGMELWCDGFQQDTNTYSSSCVRIVASGGTNGGSYIEADEIDAGILASRSTLLVVGKSTLYDDLSVTGAISATGAISGTGVVVGTDNGTSWHTTQMGQNGEYQKSTKNSLTFYAEEHTGSSLLGTEKWRYQPTVTVDGHAGNITCQGKLTASTAKIGTTNYSDYAELFEWLDHNPLNEDRRGRFVTTDGDKIVLANSESSYLLGVISGTATVVANAASSWWAKKYLTDEFGTVITQEVTYPTVLDDDGNIVQAAYVVEEPVLNPEYDETLEYIPREQRPEWGIVGLVGQLIMLDDGTCEVNGFATSADEGIATKSATQTNYRVMRRIDANHILVAAK